MENNRLERLEVICESMTPARFAIVARCKDGGTVDFPERYRTPIAAVSAALNDAIEFGGIDVLVSMEHAR